VCETKRESAFDEIVHTHNSHAHTHTHTYAHIYIFTHTHKHTQTHMHKCTHTRTHIYTYAHIHAHTVYVGLFCVYMQGCVTCVRTVLYIRLICMRINLYEAAGNSKKAVDCNTLQHTATYRAAKHCNIYFNICMMLRAIARRPWTATHCNTLHCNTPRCNTLQHIIYLYDAVGNL